MGTSARVATLNLWGASPPLERRLEVAARGLAALDLDGIFLQEVRAGEDLANTASQLARLLGAPWSAAYACATRGEAGSFGPGSTAGEEGLAILARQPIDEARDVALPDARPDERRILLSGRIVLPGGAVLWCHTTHLHYRLTDGVARERQVLAIDDAIRVLQLDDPDAIHVLGGDFNAAPDCDEVRFLRGRHTLAGRRAYWQDAFAQAHPRDPGLTWTERNTYTAPLSWLERERRIDYLFVSPERRHGRGRVCDARVILDQPSPDGVWASDHFGVMAEVAL